jgi:hypothetical protein
MGLIDGSDTQERMAFSEIHSEGTRGPCFMVRKGRSMYIHVHGHDDQLFDLEADPGEWNNLAGRTCPKGRVAGAAQPRHWAAVGAGH